MEYREAFYRGLRGRAWAESPGLTVDLELALAESNRARVEMTGPLSVRVGLLVMNAQWIQLYVPREKVVFRFPTAESVRDTARRDRFLKLLPFRVAPGLLIEALETRTGLRADEHPECTYDADRNAYRFRFRNASGGGRIAWIDPTSAAPLEIRHYEREVPNAPAKEERPDWKVLYSHLVGEGPSTLPSRIEFHSPKGKQLTFEWSSAERWEQPDDRVFDWQPPAALMVRDY